MQPTPSQSSKKTQVTPERLMQFAFGYAPAIMIGTAAELGVFDALEDGPKTASELAKATGASERGLQALSNALVGFEFLAKNGDRYSLTPESATYLASGARSISPGQATAPQSMKARSKNCTSRSGVSAPVSFSRCNCTRPVSPSLK